MKRRTCFIGTALALTAALLAGCQVWDFVRENSGGDEVVFWQPGTTIVDEQIYAYQVRFIDEIRGDVSQVWEFRTHSGRWEVRKPKRADSTSFTDWHGTSASLILGLQQCDNASRVGARQIIDANNGTTYQEYSDSTQFGYCWLWARHWGDTTAVGDDHDLLSLVHAYDQHDELFRGVYLMTNDFEYEEDMR